LRKDIFVSLLREVSQVASSILDEICKARLPFGEFSTEYQTNGKGSLSGTLKFRVDYSIMLKIISDRLSKNDSFQVLKDSLINLKMFGGREACAIATSSMAWRYSPNDLIFEAIERLLNAEPDEIEHVAIVAHSMIERYQELTHFENTGYIFLENVEWKGEPLEIDQNTEVCPLTMTDKVDWLNRNRLFESFYGLNFRLPYYFREAKSYIQFEYREEKNIYPAEEMKNRRPLGKPKLLPPAQVDRLIKVIRLLLNSTVITSPVFTCSRYTPVREQWGVTASPSGPAYAPAINLEKSKIHEISELYRILGNERTYTKTVKIALDRLERFGERHSLEDKILDIYIGIERILGKMSNIKDTQTEIRFRMSLSLAKYLGSTPSDQQCLFDTMMKGYKLRSKVAHGSDVDEKDRNIIDELDGIFRRLLIKYIHDVNEERCPSFHSLLFCLI